MIFKKKFLKIIDHSSWSVGPWDWIFHRKSIRKRHPTMKELDEVAPGNPVWITPDSYHSNSANSLTFNLINLPDTTPGLGKDVHTGKPTGLYLTDKANVPARRKVFSFLSDTDMEEMIKTIDQAAVRKGVTTIHACEGSRVE